MHLLLSKDNLQVMRTTWTEADFFWSCFCISGGSVECDQNEEETMMDDDSMEIVCVLLKTQINESNGIPTNIEIIRFNC